MCGIGGYALWTRKYLNESKKINKDLIDGIKHRGPDYFSHWADSENGIGLTHARLSILDLDNRSNQPFKTEDSERTHVLTFNGEIYNYKALRSELQDLGFKFKTSSDTEVLYHAYSMWGIQCLDHINGMFAFVIWDPKKLKIFAARDPYGIKPLYFFNDKDIFLFCSEVKPIYKIVSSNCRLNDSAFLGLMLNGYIPEPLSTYTEINKVDSGCYLEVSEGRVKQIRYASTSKKFEEGQILNNICKRQKLDVLKQSLGESIRNHMQSDAKICLFLSSGLDSTLLLALASEELRRAVPTFTLSFDDSQASKIDESKQASKIATYYGANNTIIDISQEFASQSLTKYYFGQDQPCIDGFNTWLISKAVSERGYKVAISGLGADELFSGYNYYRDIELIKSLFYGFNIGSNRKKFISFVSEKLKKKWPRVGSLVAENANIASMYGIFREVISLKEVESIMGKDFVESGINGLPSIERLTKDNFKYCSDGQLNAIDSTNYLVGQLLSVGDTASMSHSIELRTPYVDYKLLSEVSKTIVSREWKKKRKLNLVDLPKKSIPQYVYQKKKQGFSLPMDKWLKESKVYDKEIEGINWNWAKKLSLSLVQQYYC